MTVKDFQFLNIINTGSTSFIYDVAKYFNLPTDIDMEVVNEMINNITDYKTKEIVSDVITINGKKYGLEKELLNCKFSQYMRLDALLNENNNIANLHHLLAIYVRPIKKKWFKTSIEPYDVDKQELIANKILNMEIGEALGCMIFFYQRGMRYLKIGNISYLNQLKKAKKTSKKNSKQN